MTKPSFSRVDAAPTGLTIAFAGGSSSEGIEFPWHWLRDNGEDEQSLDPHTGQRRVDTFAIPLDISGALEFESPVELGLTWSDGSSATRHTADTLARVAAIGPVVSGAAPASLSLDATIDIEAGAAAAPLPVAGFGEVVVDPSGWLEALHRRGGAVLDGVPAGEAAVEQVAAIVGSVHETFYGRIWELATDVSDHADTAYGQDELGLHTDATYLVDAPDFQMFSCQHPGDRGGESVLVDGFAAARDLQARSSKHAEVLLRTPVTAHYVEPGVDTVAARPVLLVDHGGSLTQVSFNNYDRSPRLLARDDYRPFIEAYAAFREICDEPQRAIITPYAAGRLLVFDNRRMLHGRRAFSGPRRFFGCYVRGRS